ncbi:MAG: hypothetical protein HRT45_02385 [Bdellovibrionales bacterium]|nr:hypothetical protein [Bdellovibrionales bacterium]
MVSFRPYFICLSLVAASVSAVAEDYDKKDFQDRLNYLNKRYEGFFIHQRDQKRWEVRRKSGIADVKAGRKAYADKREKVRKAFVRQPPKDMEPLRLRWEAEQEKKEKRHAKNRKQFATQRERLLQIEESAKKIPGLEELGIDKDPREEQAEREKQQAEEQNQQF